MEMASITCYHSTWSHLERHWILYSSKWRYFFFVFHENQFLYDVSKDVVISQKCGFLIPVYVCLFVYSGTKKSLLYPRAVVIMSTIKVWCQFQPPFLFTSPSMEIVPHLLGNLKVTTNNFFFFKACFTNLLNAILGSIFRQKCYNLSQQSIGSCVQCRWLNNSVFTFT